MTAEPEVAETPPTDATNTYTMSVDFDGVIHSYVSGWQGADVIPDPPVVDVHTGQTSIEWLNEVSAEYEVMILTTRARYPEGEEAVRAWLVENGFEGECDVTATKGPALMYLDDRGWRFRGRFPTLKQIRYAKPWRAGTRLPRTAAENLQRRNRDLHQLEEKQQGLKREVRSLRRALLIEVLSGRGFSEEDAAAWVDAREPKEQFEARLAAARAEDVR